jgi:hypothetical protein
MKKITIQILMVASAVFAMVAAQADVPQQDLIKEVAVGVNGVYIPSGFTSQSNAYVVVNGLFPNGCYSLMEPKIKDVSNFEHEVFTMAKVKQGICLRVLVPFTKEIPFGKLASGVHTFRFIADDGTSVEKTAEIL